MNNDYEKYLNQQKRKYAKSKPIADWHKQMKNPWSNIKLLELVENSINGHGGVAYDLGCGEGYHTEDLRKMGLDAYGIELSPKRVKDGHNLGRHYIFEGDIHKLPWPNESAHLVFIHEVIEHTAFPNDVIFEIHRVLKKGGKLFASLPLEGHWHKPQKTMFDHNLNGEDNHVWKPTAQMIYEVFKKFSWQQFELGIYTLGGDYKYNYKPGIKLIDKPHGVIQATK